MTTLLYAKKLENLSSRLPFDYTLFLETFADFLSIYKSSSESNKLVYDKYKPIVVYVIRLNSKITSLTSGIFTPDGIPEFKSIVKYKKNNLNEYYRRKLLTYTEMQSILHMIDNDKISILNQSISRRTDYVAQYPTFTTVKEVVRLAEFIQEEIPDIDLTDVYKWRRKMYWKIFLRIFVA